MRTLSSIILQLPLLLFFVRVLAPAQTPASTNDTIIVMPFENASGAPGLQWISEAFPEILSQRLSLPSVFVLNRDDRLRAYNTPSST